MCCQDSLRAELDAVKSDAEREETSLRHSIQELRQQLTVEQREKQLAISAHSDLKQDIER